MTMKCRVCAGPAVIDIRRHNANCCGEHFLKLCRDQTVEFIEQFAMLEPTDRVLVGVSGGKDSLAVWDILTGSHPGPTVAVVQPCGRCGTPASNDVCPFCRLRERATAPVPIALGRARTAS